jgi:hypothetical protein
MGQAVSSHDLFLSGLKEALKTRGARVKKKDLKSFFSYIGDLCPWFPLEGTIDGKRWLRVGDCLKDYCESFGLEKVPVTTPHNSLPSLRQGSSLGLMEFYPTFFHY